MCVCVCVSGRAVAGGEGRGSGGTRHSKGGPQQVGEEAGRVQPVHHICTCVSVANTLCYGRTTNIMCDGITTIIESDLFLHH